MSAAGEPTDPLRDVAVTLSVEVGRCTMRVGDILQLSAGAVVRLERSAESPLDVLVNDVAIARGRLISVDGCYGCEITEVRSK